MKKKIIWIIGITFVAVLGVVLVAGAKGRVPKEEAQENIKASIAPPPGLEKIVFINHKKDFGKPGTECGNGICEPGEKKKCPQDCPSNGGEEESACYKFLKGRARWQWQEDYYVSNQVDQAAVAGGVAEWEKYGGNIFGSQLSGEKPWDTYDGYNALTYGNFEEPGAIAVTAVWIWGNSIVEYDMLFDSDFAWGDSEPDKMDWQNIATHELGHAAGMGDLYETTCVDETMYGYSTEGEVKKRDLNAGDITGIQKLYRK